MSQDSTANSYLIRYVESYRRAVEILLPEFKTNHAELHFVVAQLSGQVLELVFKHFLSSVKGGYDRGHDLIDLYQQSVDAGLKNDPARMLQMDELKTLNLSYFGEEGGKADYSSRYPNGFVARGGLGTPSIQRVLITVDEVVKQASQQHQSQAHRASD